MVFRKAENSEAQKILSLYESVKQTPFCTWNEYYPVQDNVTEDLSAGTLYVLERDGEIVGAASIAPENELDEYECWTVRENAAEFARVVIRPGCQGKGLSKLLVEGILSELESRGVRAVHISVAKVNIPAQKLYRSCGFGFLAEAYMYGGWYWLYEKII